MDYTSRAQKLVKTLLEGPSEADLVSLVLKNLPPRNFRWPEMERWLVVNHRVDAETARRVVQQAREYRRAYRFPE